jgi:hypothetical protein
LLFFALELELELEYNFIVRTNEAHYQHPCQLAQREKGSSTQKRNPTGQDGEKRKACG